MDEFTLERHGALWLPRLSGLKVRATETARYVVDEAIRSMGGSSYFSRNELSRLYRDVLAGIFHPSDDESAHVPILRQQVDELFRAQMRHLARKGHALHLVYAE